MRSVVPLRFLYLLAPWVSVHFGGSYVVALLPGVMMAEPVRITISVPIGQSVNLKFTPHQNFILVLAPELQGQLFRSACSFDGECEELSM